MECDCRLQCPLSAAVVLASYAVQCKFNLFLDKQMINYLITTEYALSAVRGALNEQQLSCMTPDVTGECVRLVTCQCSVTLSIVLQRRWGITAHLASPVTSPNATSFQSRMKTYRLKWRISIHSTSTPDNFTAFSCHQQNKSLWCSWFLVMDVILFLCVCVCYQGSEAERGGAVFPQHSTDAGAVWGGAAWRHGRGIPSHKLSCISSSFHFFDTFPSSSPRTPMIPLCWWVWPPVALQYSAIGFAPVSSPGE